MPARVTPRTAAALVALLALAGCGPLGGAVGSTNPVLSVRVEPDTLTLDTRIGAPAAAQFVAYATFADGEESPIDLVSWASSSPSAGALDTDGTFTAVETNGGTTTITATHAGVSGSASVTVRYLADELVGVDAAVVDAFAAATPADDSGVVITYPFDGVTVPRNLDGLTFVWEGTSSVSRLHLSTPITDVSIYSTGEQWTADAGLWEVVTAANRQGAVTAQIETGTWDGTTLTDVRVGPAITLTVNRFDATGSVLYWSTSIQGILRIPLGSTTSEEFWSAADSGNRCTGCHMLVEARDEMVVTHDGVNGTFTVVDVSDASDPQAVILPFDTNRMTFKASSPDGTRMVGVTGGVISIWSLETGQRLTEVDTGSNRYTHPDWSPDGDRVVFVRATGTYQSDMTFTGGEIVTMTWDGADLGSPTVLVPADGANNRYYPAWSPDGKWIAYNRSTGDAYADLDAEIWLVAADGSADVPLVSANGEGAAQNSYVKWGPLPDDDVLWLAYSSLRTYPAGMASGMPQIWVAAVYPEEVATDGDPSRPPFWLPGQNTTSNNHLPVWWSK
jgi:hypothetical protein